MIEKDEKLYDATGFTSAPFAILDDAKCLGCGKDAKVWSITDSAWEYCGTPLCVDCLIQMADKLSPPGNKLKAELADKAKEAADRADRERKEREVQFAKERAEEEADIRELEEERQRVAADKAKK